MAPNVPDTSRHGWRVTGPAVIVVAVVVGLTIWAIAARRADSSPAYVGSSTCAGCHTREYEAWTTSHHSKAMQLAEPGRVLGDFDDVRVEFEGQTTRFFRQGDRFMVTTDGPDGELHDFEVKYTFGVEPLQQYLVELPDGRVQALPIAWDSRPKDEGGQRWFHLYPGERIDQTDELHWTGRQQNWNFMCADCHSTGVRKGYDATRDRFRTTWAEMNVACEACHGPGSRHVEWANAPRWLRSMRWDDNGLPVHLTERRDVSWVIDLDTLVPARSQPRTTSVEIDTCAPCHARREQIAEGYVPGGVLRDHYVPDPITPDLYYADGQQREEVYTWGSFLQSRMAHAGVTCSDCHDPHTGRTRMSGNLLCASCHVPAKYDTATHHGHPADSPGAQCVACHMPATTYMQVDARRDHSIRVPRPDRTEKIGVPNPCSACHADRGAAWAAEQVRTWYGRDPGGFQTFADAFHAADVGRPGADEALARIADDRSQPAIVRASALGRLADRPGPAAQQSAARSLSDPDADVRLAALLVFEASDPARRVGFVAPLLEDPVRAVRLRAAWLLAPVANALTGTDQGRAFAKAAEEFVASRRLMADRPEARTTLGVFLTALGRRDEARTEYEAALRLVPRYTPARINLSDLHREDGREDEAARVLREGLVLAPDDAALHHALGLSLVRQGRRAEAVAALKRAAELAPESAASRFVYAYAVALHGEGRVAEAIETLERALARDPGNQDLLFALVTFHRDSGRRERALDYARRMLAAHPGDPRARALLESLERR